MVWTTTFADKEIWIVNSGRFTEEPSPAKVPEVFEGK